MNLRMTGLLSLVMLATRFPFGGDALHLIDASWAIFFILGRLQTSLSFKAIGFLWFTVLAWVIDLYAVKTDIINAYCVTPAYIGMPLAYLALTYAGVVSARSGTFISFTAGLATRGHLNLVLGSLIASMAAFGVTNAFFYRFAGYFTQMSAVEYSLHVVHYYPHYFLSLYLYVVGWHLLNRYWSLEAQVQFQTQSQQQSQVESKL